MSLLIYTNNTSNRLEYILDFVFKDVLLCDYSLTNDLTIFKENNGAKLNYSQLELKNCYQIIPEQILFETEIKEQQQLKNSIIECAKSGESSVLNFDVFAASFYLISRYEEYLSSERDEFERFPHIQSIAFKHNFLHLPLVDLWLLELKKELTLKFPELTFKKKEFTFLPTYDIDIAYSYKHKGLLRNAGSALKDLGAGNFSAIKNRIAVLLNKNPDPFDSFDFLDKLHKDYKLSPIYFFLLGSGSKLDKNLSVKNSAFKNLIRRIARQYKIGIHPSYRSNDEEQELNIEVQRLNSIASIRTTKSRQHYIRFTLPMTYQLLIEQGIKEDYSMGYGSINGFRASTAHPFFWFDLENNKQTDLRIFPFCFMECNSFFEQKQSIAKTQIELREYIEAVRKVNGTFVSIWHNFSLGTDPLWKDWSKLYQYQINYMQRSLPAN